MVNKKANLIKLAAKLETREARVAYLREKGALPTSVRYTLTDSLQLVLLYVGISYCFYSGGDKTLVKSFGGDFPINNAFNAK